MAGESTHISRKGPSGGRRIRAITAGDRRPVVRKQVVGVGRHASRWYDPQTGRRIDGSRA